MDWLSFLVHPGSKYTGRLTYGLGHRVFGSSKLGGAFSTPFYVDTKTKHDMFAPSSKHMEPGEFGVDTPREKNLFSEGVHSGEVGGSILGALIGGGASGNYLLGGGSSSAGGTSGGSSGGLSGWTGGSGSGLLKGLSKIGSIGGGGSRGNSDLVNEIIMAQLQRAAEENNSLIGGDDLVSYIARQRAKSSLLNGLG